jgi:hypothetical protein
MAYPTSPTTYVLPFGDKIRVSSNRRFILVRQNDGPFTPFIAKRSDTLDTVYREYNLLAGRTDYIIDQAEGTVLVWFNGAHELHSVGPKHRDSQFIRREANRNTHKDASRYTARTLHGEVTL